MNTRERFEAAYTGNPLDRAERARAPSSENRLKIPSRSSSSRRIWGWIPFS